jgi:hypothetical protein
MTSQTLALIVSAVSCLVAAVALVLWAIAAIRRAPLPGNGPMALPESAPAGGSFHDYCLVAAMQGMLSHGDTHDRNPVYIASRSKSIADQMVQVRRAA